MVRDEVLNHPRGGMVRAGYRRIDKALSRLRRCGSICSTMMAYSPATKLYRVTLTAIDRSAGYAGNRYPGVDIFVPVGMAQLSICKLIAVRLKFLGIDAPT